MNDENKVQCGPINRICAKIMAIYLHTVTGMITKHIFNTNMDFNIWKDR